MIILTEWLTLLITGIVCIIIGYALGRDRAENEIVGDLIEEPNYENKYVKNPLTGETEVSQIKTEEPLYFLRIKPERVSWIRKKKKIILQVVHLEDEEDF